MRGLKYKDEPITVINLWRLFECEVSLSTLNRNLAKGYSPEEAIKIQTGRKAYCMKKRGRNGRLGIKNKPKPTVEKSKLPTYSKEEALRIMAPAVNPKKCHLHSYKIYK